MGTPKLALRTPPSVRGLQQRRDHGQDGRIGNALRQPLGESGLGNESRDVLPCSRGHGTLQVLMSERQTGTSHVECWLVSDGLSCRPQTTRV